MTRPTDPAPSADSVDVDDETETTLSAADRLSARAELLRQQAERVTGGVMATFPVRVWRHFLIHNGFVLAAGVSYQALFTIFAALYLGFAVVGIIFGGDSELVYELYPQLRYQITEHITARIGYRSIGYRTKNGDNKLDFDLTGFTAGLGATF